MKRTGAVSLKRTIGRWARVCGIHCSLSPGFCACCCLHYIVRTHDPPARSPGVVKTAIRSIQRLSRCLEDPCALHHGPGTRVLARSCAFSRSGSRWREPPRRPPQPTAPIQQQQAWIDDSPVSRVEHTRQAGSLVWALPWCRCPLVFGSGGDCSRTCRQQAACSQCETGDPVI